MIKMEKKKREVGQRKCCREVRFNLDLGFWGDFRCNHFFTDQRPLGPATKAFRGKTGKFEKDMKAEEKE